MKSTIIIPAWQAVEYLPKCIEHISKQTKKPDLVMVGVDSCVETLMQALSVKGEHDVQDRRRKGALNIGVYYFGKHCYPYRIRNTLAVLSPNELLHFFDVDDVMYDKHIELHAKGVKPGRFMVANAEIIHESGRKDNWRRAHGVMSIMRAEFLRRGGFEPWKCAADTEAVNRFEHTGLLKCTTKEPTMEVVKHSAGLTMAPDTGYHTDLRELYSAEIKRRTSEEDYTGPDHVAVEHCVECLPGCDIERVITRARDTREITDKVIQGAGPPDPVEEEDQLTDVIAATIHLMKVHGRGFSRNSRAAYDHAARVTGMTR